MVPTSMLIYIIKSCLSLLIHVDKLPTNVSLAYTSTKHVSTFVLKMSTSESFTLKLIPCPYDQIMMSSKLSNQV